MWDNSLRSERRRAGFAQRMPGLAPWCRPRPSGLAGRGSPRCWALLHTTSHLCERMCRGARLVSQPPLLRSVAGPAPPPAPGRRGEIEGRSPGWQRNHVQHPAPGGTGKQPGSTGLQLICHTPSDHWETSPDFLITISRPYPYNISTISQQSHQGHCGAPLHAERRGVAGCSVVGARELEERHQAVQLVPGQEQ